MLQVRLAALKREEDGLQREKERLETEKERHFRSVQVPNRSTSRQALHSKVLSQ